MKQNHKCSNCFQIKPISEFYQKGDGYQSRCKACNNEVCSAYREKARKDKIAKGWRDLEMRK